MKCGSIDDCFAVFISNQSKSCPIWCQKASKSPGGLVVWDYHVILLRREQEHFSIYDLDTTLSFPCKAVDYFVQAFKISKTYDKTYDQMFRLVRGGDFLDYFASDRSHMDRQRNPFPNWKNIRFVNFIKCIIACLH
jgi:hypothetical protein